MSHWEFKSLAGVKDGKPILGDLSTKQKRRVKSYQRVLEKAAVSNVPQPRNSGYHVKAAIGPVGGRVLAAGNIESGDCQALHAEECAVAAYLSRTNGLGNKHQKPILALLTGQPGNPATPCGNCRDILRAVFDTSLEIVSGAPQGGVAIVATLGQYLFEEFQPVAKVTDRVTSLLKTLSGNLASEHDPYSSQESLKQMPHYRAGLTLTVQPLGFPNAQTAMTGSVGAIDLGCDYHPLYPIRDAIRGAERPQHRILDLQHVVVAVRGPGDAPHVPYRDRQHLLEFQLRLEAAGDHESDPSVLIFRVTEKGDMIQGWKTTVKRWIPFPFSPENFGEEFMERFADYYCKKKGNE